MAKVAASRSICVLESSFETLIACDTLAVADRRPELRLDHSLPIESAGGFRTAGWSVVLLSAQNAAEGPLGL
jgi:hypothetical protein